MKFIRATGHLVLLTFWLSGCDDLTKGAQAQYCAEEKEKAAAYQNCFNSASCKSTPDDHYYYQQHLNNVKSMCP